MLKVFLVEDEVIMRNGIKRNIPWEQEGFTFVGEASDGELAWPLIKKTKPDILITDIRMPFMDGLELSELVRKEMPDTKIIILSGYSEFDYAKQAITLGVTDYLLKPITSEKLMEAVRRVGDIIREEHAHRDLVAQYKKEMQENISLEKKKLFDSIVLQNHSTRELLEQGRLLGMDLTAAFYTVLLFKLMTPGESQTYSKELVYAGERVNEEINRWENVLAFDRGPEGWAFLLKAESQEQMENDLKRLEEKICELLKDNMELRHFCGIGDTVQRMSDIRHSYQSASKAFASRFFVEKSQFVRASQIEKGKLMETQDMSLISVDSSKINRKLVENFLKVGVAEEIDDFVEEYFDNIGPENYRSLMFCHYLIVDMNFCAYQFLESLGLDPAALPGECREVDQFSDYATSPEGMMRYVKRLFTETLRLRDSSARNKYQYIIEAAKTCVLENFQNNEFSMNQAAAMVNISPSYFSTLFRQETGTTFIEYLTDVRLGKAKELLMCTDMRSSEIGYQVGYKDSHYFSYIFKKICGCTPKEYRARKSEG
ncbi:MAG: response regulator [Lachnospiraceae bacterium]|nr:response regulator [Lachnospiraceae bacterium]